MASTGSATYCNGELSTIELRLSKDEAQALADLMYVVGGAKDKTARKHTDSVGSALKSSGVVPRERAISGLTGKIRFSSEEDAFNMTRLVENPEPEPTPIAPAAFETSAFIRNMYRRGPTVDVTHSPSRFGRGTLHTATGAALEIPMNILQNQVCRQMVDETDRLLFGESTEPLVIRHEENSPF